MEKLIFVHNWGDEGCSGQSIIPFEFTSKDDAILKLVEEAEKQKEQNVWTITLFNEYVFLDIDEIKNIYTSVFTLDEWFNQNKSQLKVTTEKKMDELEHAYVTYCREHPTEAVIFSKFVNDYKNKK